MKLFLLSSSVPFEHVAQRDVSAVHIQTFELIKALRYDHHEVVLQIVFDRLHDDGLTPIEQRALGELGNGGVTILDPVFPSEYLLGSRATPGASRPARALRFLTGQVRVRDFYPAIHVRDSVCARIRSSRCDAVLSCLSPEGLAATHGFRDLPKLAFQGDVDFQPARARFQERKLWRGSAPIPSGGPLGRLARAARTRPWLAGFRRAHLELMRDVDAIANTAQANADLYAAAGHSRSRYVGTTWPDRGIPKALARRRNDESSRRPIRIVGHVGHLHRTGSTFGLRFLLTEVVPALRGAMRGIEYEVHIVGGGEPVPALRPLLHQDSVVLRGYVNDLDAELASSDVFLFLNNAGPLRAIFSRQIMAWALGLCLVAHENSREALPELRHGENALLGATGDEIADQVRLASTDAALNRRLRRGGRETYEQHFTPAIVARKLVHEIDALRQPPHATVGR